MLPFKKILVPLDFSDPSRNALAGAVEIAEQFSAKLLVLHVMTPLPGMYAGGYPDGLAAGSGMGMGDNVIPPMDIKNYQEKLLESNREKLVKIVEEIVPDSLKKSTNIETGNAGSEICRFAEKNDIDLIVISTHGLTGFTRFIMGSVTEKVVRRAVMPVLVVRHTEAED
ncbi:MAG: universal stress protein [Desulfobulbaceae bacterium]|nr:universal stress protein [Desulfobulbaceae bacterium]